MAKVAVTKEGAGEIRDLGNNLRTTLNDIETCGSELVSSLSQIDDLGDFENDVLELAKGINQAQVAGLEAVEGLIKKLGQLADDIELLASCL